MLSVEHLSFSYPCGREILRDVSFAVESGSFLAVLGNNGAGKSTLLKCLDRLLRPRSGAVLLDGADLLALSPGSLARRAAFVAQENTGAALTVYETVLLGRRPYLRWGVSAEDRRVTEQVLRRLDLEALAHRELDRLSGGERQKVLLGRALAQQPRLLLLDEPTSSLDLRNQYEVLDLVRRVCREEGITAVAVLHDLNQALRFCDRFLLLRSGAVHAAGDASVVTPAALLAVYGVEAQVTRAGGEPVVVVRSAPAWSGGPSRSPS